LDFVELARAMGSLPEGVLFFFLEPDFLGDFLDFFDLELLPSLDELTANEGRQKFYHKAVEYAHVEIKITYLLVQ